MLQVQAYAPGFLLALVTVAALVAEPARRPEPGTGGTGEAEGELAAIPASQMDFNSEMQTTNSTVFAAIPGSQVTIDNGTATRRVIVQFSTEAHVTDPPDGFLYRVNTDGAGCGVAGPEVLTRSAEDFAARTVIYAFSLGPGLHTIVPCWRKEDDGDGLGSIVVGKRTLTVEGRTK